MQTETSAKMAACSSLKKKERNALEWFSVADSLILLLYVALGVKFLVVLLLRPSITQAAHLL